MNAAVDNDVITMYGNTVENVIIGTARRIGRQGPPHHRLWPQGDGASSASPVITVQSSAGKSDGAGGNGTGEKDIQIDDVNVIGGTYGYLVQTGTATTSTTTTLHQVGPGR